MKLSRLFLTMGICLLGILSVQAQSSELKIGYTNVNYILSQLPETKQIESELKTHEEQLGAQLQSKMKEFEDKYKAFSDLAGQGNVDPVILNDKQTELQNLQSSIQKFQQEAEQSLQVKQQELLKPAYDKIQSNIDAVAKENGYTHIFATDTQGAPILLYAQKQDDISDLVLAKLGISTE